MEQTTAIFILYLICQQKSVPPGKRSLSDPEIHFSKPFAHPIILTVNPSSENCGKVNTVTKHPINSYIYRDDVVSNLNYADPSRFAFIYFYEGPTEQTSLK